MKVEVEIEEWMSDHDVREEIDASARRVIDQMVREQLERETNRGSLDTAISNAAYGAVKDMLSDADPAWFDKLGEKVGEVVDDLSAYTVFHDSERDGSTFGRHKRTYGAEALYRSIDEHKDAIDAKVAELIDGVDRKWLARAAGLAMADELCGREGAGHGR